MKSLLVHLDASPRSAVRLALAQQLAAQHGAELTAVYGVVPPLLSMPWVSDPGLSIAAPMLAELEEAQRARARAVFDAAAPNGPLAWADLRGDGLLQELTLRALTTDLLVLGQADPHDGLTGAVPADLVPSLIARSGRPALVVPAAGTFDSTAGPVLVAWKPTREAARAVTAALPWLRVASRVHVAAQAEPDAPVAEATTALVHWLRLQGVTAPIRSHQPSGGEIGMSLLGLAIEIGARLLVMGCYGHGRAREWALGGATRSVLNAMTVPVLMAH